MVVVSRSIIGWIPYNKTDIRNTAFSSDGTAIILVGIVATGQNRQTQPSAAPSSPGMLVGKSSQLSGQSTLESSQVSSVFSSGSQTGISASLGTISDSPTSSAQPALSAKTLGPSSTNGASSAQSSVSDAFAIPSQTAMTIVVGNTTLRYRKETIESLKTLTAPIAVIPPRSVFSVQKWL